MKQANNIFELAFSLVLGIGGTALLWHYSNWQCALAVMLIIWGDNIGKSGK